MPALFLLKNCRYRPGGGTGRIWAIVRIRLWTVSYSATRSSLCSCVTRTSHEATSMASSAVRVAERRAWAKMGKDVFSSSAMARWEMLERWEVSEWSRSGRVLKGEEVK